MLSVTEAAPGDLAVMNNLLGELFGMETDFAGIDDPVKRFRGLQLILQHPDHGRLLVLKRGEQVVGMVNLVFLFSTAEGGPVIQLEDFIIADEERGKGSGRFFMDRIVEYAEENGFLRISLLADAGNARALAFYEAAGYRYSNMKCLRLGLSGQNGY